MKHCSVFFPILAQRMFALLACQALVSTTYAQQCLEFPKGWVFPVEVGQGGIVAEQKSQGELYVGSLFVEPMYTVVPCKLRVGASAGGSYADRQMSGLLGPRVAFKLKEVGDPTLGSFLNVQLFVEHLWGTRSQRLLGGGLAAEIGQIGIVSLRAYHDYHGKQLWLQTSVGINLFRQKNQ